MSDVARFVVVVPVYNDSKRLADFAPGLAESLAACGEVVTLCIADDGSVEEERSAARTVVTGLQQQGCPAEFLEFTHRGKGAAVREAWAHYPQAKWLAFVDADGATPAGDVVHLLEHARTATKPVAVVGERSAQTVYVRMRRKFAHRAFAMIARRVLRIGIPDPQCGAKIIPGAIFRQVHKDLKEDGFAFDCELLVALQGRGVVLQSIPVSWKEKQQSTLRVSRVAWPMLRAIFRIRSRYF